MSGFCVGESVVCVDAADIPAPWKQLTAGEVYTIRSIELVPSDDGNYDKNVHKKAKYLVRLWGVNNPVHPPIGTNVSSFGKELGYADSRFEQCAENVEAIENREELEKAA